ncbi:lipopolysaccharide biosynthesis protein [Nocardioides daejeonensis]|uniref:lipopolysaccharide biosynthesis protein n=1 Tax=Nocardioides daejeonensis TaxID=1046556 RepID=UPI000D742D5C|nr:hypothetical protein [Nocardioides daejeonensis]
MTQAEQGSGTYDATEIAADEAPTQGSGARSLILSGAFRLFGLIPQAIATLLASRLIFDHYGMDAFNAYALVIAMMALIPLNNLGMGASLTQAIAARGPHDEHAVGAALTASRVLSLSALGLSVVALVFGALGMWPEILGDAAGGNWFTAAALVVFAATFVPGLAPSVLLGADRNHVAIVVGWFLAPMSLLLVGVLIVGDLAADWVLLVPPLAMLVVNIATVVVSARTVGFPWLRVLRELPWRRQYAGARIRSLSGPMLITSLCVPVTFWSDRIVLSHVSTPEAVADYSVVLQLAAPIIALIIATAQPLWPMITAARARGQAGPAMTKIFLAFGLGTLLCCIVFVALADPIGHLIGGDEVDLGYTLPVVAALALLLMAVAFPLSMTMVDPVGARFVAGCALLTLPTNVIVSIFLSREFGAIGPLLSLLIVSTTIQVVPILIYSNRRERAGGPIKVLDDQE